MMLFLFKEKNNVDNTLSLPKTTWKEVLGEEGEVGPSPR